MEQIIADNKTLLEKNGSLSFTKQLDHQVSADTRVSTVTSVGIDPRTVTSILMIMFTILLVICVAIILINNMTGQTSYMLSKLDEAFNFDIELNIPSYFNTLLLLWPSMLLGVIAYLKFKKGEQYVVHWAILAAGFFFMSFDEMTSVHERLIKPVRNMMGGEHLGFFYFAWTVPAIVLVLILSGIFLRFWWRLPSRTRLFCAISAAVYLGGVLGMEMVDGKYADLYGKENLTYMLLSTFEETMEMVGLIIFIKTLLEYMANAFPKMELHFRKSENINVNDVEFSNK